MDDLLGLVQSILRPTSDPARVCRRSGDAQIMLACLSSATASYESLLLGHA